MILIANRGEIALRVMRTARAMGYRCAVVHTAADAGAAHVQAAEAAVQVPSYLDGPAIVAAARALGARMVHPGYGYLSENAAFAQAVIKAGLVWIGPSPGSIALMGDKGRAKAAALAAGVPVLPGGGPGEAAALGVPLMVKAAFGGGGKGMRLVLDPADLPEALERAASEAERAFGDGTLIVERALLDPRHIEVQVFGDSHGNVVHLGERDCSVQRRHQKVIEEAPSPAVDTALRDRLGAAAVALAQGYVGAGTVEFLVQGGEFYFLEMNTRLQVEHPVTEAVTGLDLVEWQIRVARGEPLPLAQEQITLKGHAIEARLCAEDPSNGFLPQTGMVLGWAPDPGLRVDHAVAVGDAVGGDFDPLLAKLIAHGPSREEARQRLIAGLGATRLLGLRTNRAFLAQVLAHPGFIAGPTTALLGRITPETATPDPAMLALAVLVLAGAPSPRFGFSTGPAPVLTRRFDTGAGLVEIRLTLEGPTARLADGRAVTVLERDAAQVLARIDGVTRRLPCVQDGGTLHLGDLILTDVTLAPPQARAETGDGPVLAPMAGRVLAVPVAEGESVTAGQVLAVLEAMKMEHPLRAPVAGRVVEVAVSPGAQVRARQMLMRIEGEAK